MNQPGVPQPQIRNYIILPFILLVCLFSPVFKGYVPLNSDILTSRYPPFKTLTPNDPMNPEMDDPVLQMYPLFARANLSLELGCIPLWNPDIACGIPSIGDSHTKPLDPFFLVTGFLPLSSCGKWTLLIFLQFASLIIVSAFFFRTKKISAFPANLGITALIFSGYTVTWSLMRLYIPVIFSLILAFFIIESSRTVINQNRRLFLSFPIGILFLSGHSQFALYALIAVAVFDFCRSQFYSSSLLLKTSMFFIPYILGIMLGSAALIPELELIAHAFRGSSPIYFKSYYFGAGSILSLTCPRLFGHPADGTYQGLSIFGKSFMNLPSLYFGLGGLMFTGYGILRKTPGSSIFGSMVAAIFCFTSGLSLAPFRSFLYGIWPGFFDIDPARLSGIALPLMVILATEGIDRFFKDLTIDSTDAQKIGRLFPVLFLLIPVLIGAADLVVSVTVRHSPDVYHNKLIHYVYDLGKSHGSLLLAPALLRTAIIAFVYFGITSGMVYFRKHARWFWMLLTVLWSYDLFFEARSYIPFSPPNSLSSSVKLDDFITSETGHRYRVTGVDSSSTSDYAGQVLPPNTSILVGFSDFRGYISNPLDSYMQYRYALMPPSPFYDRRLTVFESPFLDAASVKWLITSNERIHHSFTPVYQAESCHIYRNDHAFPNAWFIEKIRLSNTWANELASKDSAMQILAGTAFINPSFANLFLENDVFASGSLTISRRSDHQMEIYTRLPAPGFMVVNDTYYPGWRVEINGKRSVIYPVDLLFRGMRIPAGESIVRMQYHPVSLLTGLFCFCCAFFLLPVVYSFRKALKTDPIREKAI